MHALALPRASSEQLAASVAATIVQCAKSARNVERGIGEYRATLVSLKEDMDDAQQKRRR